MSWSLRVSGALLGAALLLSGCALNGKPYNYAAFQAHPPTSILVLPPVNHSANAKAPGLFLSTITKPLAEQGYYVFPVWLVDDYLRAHGGTGTGTGTGTGSAPSTTIPLSQLQSTFAPDAVLYTTIHHWAPTYRLSGPALRVALSCRLVDASSGALLWRGKIDFVNDITPNPNGSPLAMLLETIAGSIGVREVRYSRTTASLAEALMIAGANKALFIDPNIGLPYGPYNPKAKTDARR